MNRPVQRVFGFLNWYVLRHLWLRVSWWEGDDGKMSHLRLSVMHPRKLYEAHFRDREEGEK